eukprot:CAMPEP_0197520842 /NCGR_PEP_ID=MMETSP1318-20131121/6178_1 /TAXON_ID=552666 /ORGANISM="Partenskyella glossopodia, Strain RCC365" /LENGTH=47 /DNA_ID= /DNA_START= /DNA_END= /DNA_ORIENTATION=
MPRGKRRISAISVYGDANSSSSQGHVGRSDPVKKRVKVDDRDDNKRA